MVTFYKFASLCSRQLQKRSDPVIQNKTVRHGMIKYQKKYTPLNKANMIRY